MRRLLLAFVFGSVAAAQKPAFVEIPAGSFLLGCEPGLACAETFPRKQVTFDRPFQITKHEITVAQFRAFANASGYQSDAEKGGDRYTWNAPEFALSSQQPVVYMTLNDAKAYCESIGATVPTEAQWEYAARAGTTTWHYWGEEIDGRYLWYFNNISDQRPQAVGRKHPNAWGVYDVEGNAMEWVRFGPHSSITKETSGSVRGGSYASCPEPYVPENGRRQRPIGLGPTFEKGKNSNFRPDERRYDYGIRCVK